MSTKSLARGISRRDFLKMVGGTMGASAMAAVMPRSTRSLLLPAKVAHAAQAPDKTPDLVFAGTDGWVYLPPTPAIPPFHPDVYAPAPFTTYIFGFRNVTGLSGAQIAAQKNKAQHVAPLWWTKQYDGTIDTEFHVKLTNLGLAQRPDLTDSHTIHWHGFRDAIPYFDGEPHGSVSVPINKELTYVYRPSEPGTYMYHCHVEDVEHVHMGMAGMLFVRPSQDGNTSLYPSGKYTYNDGDGSTGFDREFSMMLTEMWAEAHWADAHIQLPEWSDYRADFALLNGRVYPDTVAPNGGWADFYPIGTDPNGDGDLIAPTGRPELRYQPISSLVTCNAGERVLLRFANLGYTGAVMNLPGIKMRVVGKDATPMRGRDGTNTSYLTNSIPLYSGSAADAIFTAPAYQGPSAYDTYLLVNRTFLRADNLAPGGFGGQKTEVRVYPPGTLPPQALPNT